MVIRPISVTGFVVVLVVAVALLLGLGCAKKQPDVDLAFVTEVIDEAEQYKQDQGQVAELRAAILSLEKSRAKIISGEKPLKEGIDVDEWLEKADAQLAHCRGILQKAESACDERAQWLLSVQDKFRSEYAKVSGE